MAALDLPALASFARAELLAQHVDRPGVAAQLDQVRRIVAAGRGTEAGLHTIAGVVDVVVLDGVERGFAPGELVLDVRGTKLDPVKVRRIVGDWLGVALPVRRGNTRPRWIVRVREASALDHFRSWVRWARVRRAARRAILAASRVS
jgi:hypothetical protein